MATSYLNLILVIASCVLHIEGCLPKMDLLTCAKYYEAGTFVDFVNKTDLQAMFKGDEAKTPSGKNVKFEDSTGPRKVERDDRCPERVNSSYCGHAPPCSPKLNHMPAPKTIFVPNSKSFQALPENVLKNITIMRDVIQYHIVNSYVDDRSWKNEDLLPTANKGVNIRVNIYENKTAKVTTVSGSWAIVTRLNATNGYINLISRVMFPLPTTNLFTEVAVASNFKIFLLLVTKAGLQSTLRGGSYTLFVPNDNAFDKLPQGTLASWMEDIPKLKEEEGKKEKMRKEENRSVLQRSNKDHSMVGAKIPLGSLVIRDFLFWENKHRLLPCKTPRILFGHVVEGSVYTEGFDILRSVKTLANNTLTTGRFRIGSAKLVGKVDQPADNGVLHEIDSVLPPP